MKRMVLSFAPYTLALRDVFSLASSSRRTTPAVLTEIACDGLVGYGEASLPPYLGETQQSVGEFLARLDLGRYADPCALEEILADIDAVAPGNAAAKASVDIALHDLAGKIRGRPWYALWGFDGAARPYTSFTIGIDTAEVVRRKTQEAAAYRFLKVKLGRDTDRMLIETIRSVTDVPLFVDVNEGWRDRERALAEIHWLAARGVVLVEQPLPKERHNDMAWLTERSPLPTVADEAVQRLSDIPRIRGAYTGINIKLMKCTGMREARAMLTAAREAGLKVMLGCMTESSCAISAASHLASEADWVDLDGALLVANDPFEGTRIEAGRVTLTGWPGIGARPRVSFCGLGSLQR